MHTCIVRCVPTCIRMRTIEEMVEEEREETGVKTRELVSSTHVIPRSRWVSRMTVLCSRGVRVYATRVGAPPTKRPPPLSRFPPPRARPASAPPRTRAQRRTQRTHRYQRVASMKRMEETPCHSILLSIISKLSRLYGKHFCLPHLCADLYIFLGDARCASYD